MRQVFLTGEKANLVLLEKDDLPLLQAGMNDLETTRYLSRGHLPATMTEEEAWFQNLESRTSDLVLGIHVPEDDMLIGTAGLHGVNGRDQKAELGISIFNANYRSRGVGTEVIELLLLHAFNRMNLNGVVLGVLSNNPRGQRCYEKCGFKEVGRLPNWVFKEGAWHDHIHMVALRS